MDIKTQIYKNYTIVNSSLRIFVGALSSPMNYLDIRIDGIINPRYSYLYNVLVSIYTYLYDDYYIGQQSPLSFLVNPSGINVISVSNNSVVGARALYNITLNTQIFNK
jgi:hypothetical protein